MCDALITNSDTLNFMTRNGKPEQNFTDKLISYGIKARPVSNHLKCSSARPRSCAMTFKNGIVSYFISRRRSKVICRWWARDRDRDTRGSRPPAESPPSPRTRRWRHLSQWRSTHRGNFRSGHPPRNILPRSRVRRLWNLDISKEKISMFRIGSADNFDLLKDERMVW